MSSPDRHKDRDLYDEYSKTLDAQAAAMEKLGPLQKEWAKKFAQNDVDIAKMISPQIVEMMGQLGPQLQQQDIDTARMRRGADVEDIETYGKRAVDAIRGSDPAQQALLNKMNKRVMGDLDRGGELDAYSERQLRQSPRANLGARGISPGDIGALGIEELVVQEGRERRKQQGFAQAAQMSGINKATGADAALMITGRPSTIGAGVSSSVFGQGASYNPGQLFNPESQYAGSLYNQNLQAELGYNIAKTNTVNETWGGGMEAAMSMMAGWCWVAREVYGADNPRWLMFREWMLNDSPNWLFKLYTKFGERFANWLKGNAWLKPAIRKFMDSKIRVTEKDNG
jgi:hypothetical protein